MTAQILFYNSPNDLPENWENVLFQGSELYSRSFLYHLKQSAASQQHYYFVPDSADSNGGIISTLKLRAIRLFPLMNAAICRYPLALPTRGYSYTKGSEGYALKAIASRLEVLKIIVYEKCLPVDIPKSWHIKNSMPYAIFYNKFNNFEEYLNRLTKYYRKSIKKSLSKLGELKIVEEQGSKFTIEHYRLYQSVTTKSRYQGFNMSLEFFTKMSLKHEYISVYQNNIIVGWILLLYVGQRVYAPICGFDSDLNIKYDIWRNLHIATIKKTIAQKYESIDFGDTAEEGKVRLGCTLEPRYLLVKHENKLLNLLLSVSPWFEYRPRALIERSCFKEDIKKTTGQA